MRKQKLAKTTPHSLPQVRPEHLRLATNHLLPHRECENIFQPADSISRNSNQKLSPTSDVLSQAITRLLGKSY